MVADCAKRAEPFTENVVEGDVVPIPTLPPFMTVKSEEEALDTMSSTRAEEVEEPQTERVA